MGNHKDEFKFEVFKIGKKAKMLPPTKRNLLIVLASLFDPLGIISPSIIYVKVLFQEVCKAKIDWDQERSLPKQAKKYSGRHFNANKR